LGKQYFMDSWRQALIGTYQDSRERDYVWNTSPFLEFKHKLASQEENAAFEERMREENRRKKGPVR